MKNNMLKISAFLLIVSFLFAAGCGKSDDDGGSNKNKNNGKTENVPDPEGTITANIAEEVYVLFGGYGVSWTRPDNIAVSGGSGYNVSDLISICNVGQVKGLGSITTIPVLGYTNPTAYGTNKSMSCDVGCGYVIKMERWEYLSNYPTYSTYARMYVVEKIISTSGGIMGAKVKYQYPFVP